MNRKQLSILIVLLVVLGAAGLMIQHSRNEAGSSSSDSSSGGKLLGDKFDVNSVARISFKEGTNDLNLVYKNELWRVRERDDYAANYDMIRELLTGLANQKVVQSEHVDASQLSALQLSTNATSAVLLTLWDKNDKPLKSLTLGKMHMRKPSKAAPSPFGDEGFPDGRYLTVSSDPQTVLVIASPLSSASAKPGLWLNKDFFKVERPQSISVSYPGAETNSWKLVRATEAASWTLADAKPDETLDTNKLYGVTAPFGQAAFNDVAASSAKPEDNGLDRANIVTVHTFDDFTYTVKVGRKTGEDYAITLAVTGPAPTERVAPADEKPDDKEKADKAWKDQQKQIEDKLKQAKSFENHTYLVSPFTVDSLLKERKDLLAEKKEEPKPADKSEPAAEKKDEIKTPATPSTGTDK